MGAFPFADEPEDEIAQDPGTTRVLATEGWEESTYIDPEEDWELQPDGSYVSPDGTIRTWPLVTAEPG